MGKGIHHASSWVQLSVWPVHIEADPGHLSRAALPASLCYSGIFPPLCCPLQKLASMNSSQLGNQEASSLNRMLLQKEELENFYTG